MLTKENEILKKAFKEYYANGFSSEFQTYFKELLSTGFTDFNMFRGDVEKLSKFILENGSPMNNVVFIKHLDYLIDDIYLRKNKIMEHNQKVLLSKDKEANFKCYLLNKNLCRNNLEVLNDNKDKFYYKKYLQEMINLVNNEVQLLALNSKIIQQNDVELSRALLNKINKSDLRPCVITKIWNDNAQVFEDFYKNHKMNIDANDAIWFLTKAPSDFCIKKDLFNLLENAVLKSNNGSYNLIFMLNYPNVNFKQHEFAILRSKSGMTISQYATEFSVSERKNLNKKGENKALANISACAKAISQSDSETAMYAFANKFEDKLNTQDMNLICDRLINSKSAVYSDYAQSHIIEKNLQK